MLPELLATRKDLVTNRQQNHSQKSQKEQNKPPNKKWRRPVKNCKTLS